ncbi:MAG TPA: RHS repeat-associated core domain-containing protein, partial [Yaniella sp.]
GQRTFHYDVAGQLVRRIEPGGQTIEYQYDGQGRRIRATSPERTTDYTWSDHGWLSTITEQANGTERSTALWVNALGELAAIDDTALHWDAAADLPRLVGIGDTPVLHGPAGFTGVGDQLHTPTWRHARATDHTDPWQILEATQQATLDLPAGTALTADGGLQIAGLEWMGARVYDAGARGFLSVDPIAPPAGTAWSASPYSYAGNDPLHMVDPHGLEPVSDAELQAYADGLQGPLARGASAVGDWLSENREYIFAGALVAGGVVVMATGFGGPLGAAMISGALTSGGLSAGMQKYTNGSVDWAAASREALLGGLLGGVGAGASNLTKSFLVGKSSSAKAAYDTYKGAESVRQAGTGLWSKLNGTTKYAEAAKLGAGKNFNTLVDNYVRDIAGDTMSNMATTNTSYILDVALNDDKDFDFTEFAATNGSAVFESTVSATFKFGSGGVNMPVDLTEDSPTSQKVGRFTREFLTGTAIDSTSTFVDWQITRGLEGEAVSSEDRAEDMIDSGASNLGSGLHESFPNIHIGGGK